MAGALRRSRRSLEHGASVRGVHPRAAGDHRFLALAIVAFHTAQEGERFRP